MGLIEKLQEILTIKNNIKTSIESKNVTVGNKSFSEYPNLIKSIQSGGGSGGDELILDTAEFLFFQGARLSYLDKLLKGLVDGTCRYYRAFYQFSKSFTMPNPCEFKYTTTTFENSYYGKNFEYIDLDETFYYATGMTTLNIKDRGYPFYLRQSFYNCTKLKEITSTTGVLNVGSADRSFQGCSILESIPKLIINGNPSLQQTFRDCKKLKKVELEGRTTLGNFAGVSPTTIPLYYTFHTCSSLESVTGLDITNFTSVSSPFYKCTNLKVLDFTGTENVQINLDLSTTGLDAEGLMNMLETLPDISTSRTITIGSEKMALLSEADIALFTSKGYTLA